MSGGAFRVQLSNGHRLVARLPGRLRLSLAHLVLGDRVGVQMSPYDLSRGTIVMKEKQS